MGWTNGVSTLYHADAREVPLPDASVHCVVTSPPYWGLPGLRAGSVGRRGCRVRAAKEKQSNMRYRGSEHLGLRQSCSRRLAQQGAAASDGAV